MENPNNNQFNSGRTNQMRVGTSKKAQPEQVNPPVKPQETAKDEFHLFDPPVKTQEKAPQKTEMNTSSAANAPKKPARQLPRKPKSDEMSKDLIKSEKLREAKKRVLLKNFGKVGIIMAVVVAISMVFASIAISCVNDLLVISISEKRDTAASVVISDGMDTADVIDALDDAGLVKNGWFCKLAAKFIGYSDDGYIARTYDLKRSMGLENMLNEIKNNTSKTAKTVTLTFPEGYNADQIMALLETNGVCTRAKLIEAMNTVDFSKDFDYLATMSNVENRYIKLEGYLFPDTYEFYLGESAESVIKKFLNNFNNKWTDEFAEAAQKLRLSVDQVVKLASVVEKEAVGADMPVVGSILLNRLEIGMPLECDSTSSYIQSNKSGLSEQEVERLDLLYDTYRCDGMPVGAICNPGIDSIQAVLNAPETDYYYFIHDSNNEFHVAKTLSQQEYNIATYGLAD